MITVYSNSSIATDWEKESSSDLQEYKENLLSLSPEEVITEYFQNMSENNIPRLKELVYNAPESTVWDQSNIKFIELMDIVHNEKETERFISYYANESFISAKAFDVTYDVEYKKTITQGNGVHTWTFNMIKIDSGEPWLIHSSGWNF